MPWPTHTVSNQPPPLVDFNLLATDAALIEGVRLEGAHWHLPALQRLGARLGSTEVQTLAELANRHAPELATHDRFGNRIDVVEFHPAWHSLLKLLRQSGLQALPSLQTGAHVSPAASFFCMRKWKPALCVRSR